MKYVNRIVGRDGITRLYFRKKGHPKNGTPLSSPWPVVPEGSLLEIEVQALVGSDRVKPRPTNLAGAVRRYELEDPRWKVLEESTKREYRRYLAEFDDEMGSLPLSTFTANFLLELQNAWALRGHRAAELRMNVLKNVLNPMLIAADLPDPFARLPGVPSPRKDQEPHRVWPEHVVERVIRECIELGKPGIARAVAIARYTGARRGDLVKMLKSARNGARVRWLSGKKRVPVDQPEALELTAWLSATPEHQPLSRWQRNADRRAGVTRMPSRTLVYNRSDKPYTEDGLWGELKPIIEALHTAGEIDSPSYDLHGLRHTMGVELALAGATDAQGAAWLGHASPHSFATYRRQASRMLLTNSAGELILKLRAQANGTAAERTMQNDCKEVQNGPAAIGLTRR